MVEKTPRPSSGASDALDLQTTWVTTIRTFNQPQPADQGALTAGRALFATNCASCHGGAKWTKSRTSTLYANNPTFAEDPAPPAAEPGAAGPEAGAPAERTVEPFKYETGDVVLPNKVATLHLGEKYHYLAPEEANKVLQLWGNPPDEGPLDPRNIKKMEDEAKAKKAAEAAARNAPAQPAQPATPQ